MQNNGYNLLSKNFPYTIETIFRQICYYKCFEVNLIRYLLMDNISNLQTVKFINAYWFEQWKKISCYEAIKYELNMNCTVEQNFNEHINEYYKIVETLNFNEKLSPNIENDYILSGYDEEIKMEAVDYKFEFEIISKELWDLFSQPNFNISNNIDIGNSIELKLERLTKDSLLVHLSSIATYVIFWQREKQTLGKIIFEFSNMTERDCVIIGIKNLPDFATFYACCLENLKDNLDINFSGCSFKCINKTQKNLNIENYKKLKMPVGLVNVRMTCYMNAALQSLFHSPKLTNYLLKHRKDIQNLGGYHSLLSEYLKIVINLSRKGDSKFEDAYSPREFFNIISNESEFNGFAGDSIDMIRFFLEKMHSVLNGLNNENCIFFKYFINSNSNNYNLLQKQDINLNNFIQKNSDQ